MSLAHELLYVSAWLMQAFKGLSMERKSCTVDTSWGHVLPSTWKEKVRLGSPVDFTFSNQSGHYTLVPNSKIVEKGNVGYLALRKSFNITTDESLCLNFHYYGYGRRYVSHLKVYAWMLDSSETIQTLWPPIYGRNM